MKLQRDLGSRVVAKGFKNFRVGHHLSHTFTKQMSLWIDETRPESLGGKITQSGKDCITALLLETMVR